MPNVRDESSQKILTIKKKVTGSAGNKNQKFGFTVETDGADEKIVWAKNSDEQPEMSPTGGSFTLAHGDRAELMLPPGVTVTVSENSEGCSASFRLNGTDQGQTDSLTFEFTDTAELEGTNKLDTVIAAGLSSAMGKALAAVLIPFTAAAVTVFITRRKRKHG